MMNHSSGVLVAWQIAAAEAARMGYEYIEREHLFIGLCKIGDVLESRVVQEWEGQLGNLDMLKEEVDSLEHLLCRCNMDRIKLRRLVRGLMGKGNYFGTHRGRVVHRSLACKILFERGMDAARSHGVAYLSSIHLLSVILKDPGPHISKTLSQSGVVVEEVKKAVSQMGVAAPVVVGARETRHSNHSFLERYGVDLTHAAVEGKIEPLVGRREELLQVVRTLSRKNKNNPLLLGDPGVGKTAIVRGLALRIASGEITSSLRDKRVIELNIGMLVAGTKYRGEFEERIIGIVAEAKAQPDVILFIDEIHTLIGAGSASGSLDAANILKPALSQGEISCIGSTTHDEYRKYIEKDAALDRRFQPIMVEEPSADEALKILEGLKERYERHHQVKIASAALNTAVELSARHLPDRRLPDKALDLLDEACTRVKIQSVSSPEGVSMAEERVVIPEIVAQVLSEWTGLPLTQLAGEEKERLNRMADLLGERVIGQDEAVERVSRVVKMARSGLRDPRKPIGVFLFLGPTGVGKTELARALAEFLFGTENEMIRFDMSEYSEKHHIARLIGAPPGYVGYDEEGQLTGKLRRKPYAVVLLDEVEKAHPEIFDLFLQVFDEGRLTDAHGRTVDAQNAIFIMTSNIAVGVHARRPLGFAVQEHGAERNEREQGERMTEALRKTFRPEFLNRIDEIVVFRTLEGDDLHRIACKMLTALCQRIEKKGIRLEISDEAVRFVCKEGYDPANGARPLARTIERMISRPLSELLIGGKVKAGDALRLDEEGGTVTIQKI